MARCGQPHPLWRWRRRLMRVTTVSSHDQRWGAEEDWRSLGAGWFVLGRNLRQEKNDDDGGTERFLGIGGGGFSGVVKWASRMWNVFVAGL